MSWEIVIGLEVHAELCTATKLFCSCPNVPLQKANTSICEVCIGLPGTLPALNKNAVELAVRLGRTLGCQIQNSDWARKHYFYPDLPKGFQTTQHEIPVCMGGVVPTLVHDQWKYFELDHIHLEEDAGKLSHSRGESFIDLNRAGVPLVEIVSKPCMRSPSEAVEFMKTLRNTLRLLKVSHAHMEKGQMRCDANISIRKLGDPELGKRVEVKNINSFRFLKQALEYEVERQIEVVNSGNQVVRETRGFDSTSGTTYSMRNKEQLQEYRYFREPDLGLIDVSTLIVDESWNGKFLKPSEIYHYLSDLKLSEQSLTLLMDEIDAASWLCKAIDHDREIGLELSNWFINTALPVIRDSGVDFSALNITPAECCLLVKSVLQKVISLPDSKTIFKKVAFEGGNVSEEINSRKIPGDSNLDIEKEIKAFLETCPGEVSRFKAGEIQLKGWFVGQLMRKFNKKADPKKVSQCLEELLS